jgi:sRNA-binding protein
MSNNATMETAIAELAVAFPAAFTLDPTLVRPFKLGIKDDIYAQSAISRRRIAAALRSCCNSVHYLRASTEGAVRIDLTGEPAGTVTGTEARHATERVSALAKVAAKRASKVAGASRGAQTPKRHRHGVTSGRYSGAEGKRHQEGHARYRVNYAGTEAAITGRPQKGSCG